MTFFRLKGVLSLSLAIFLASSSSAAIPDGYYSSCNNKTGKALLEALEDVISAHKTVGYKDGLPSLYAYSDVKSPGIIWDMYSTANFSVTDDKCGSYSKVGDCWNREHSFPKSWFKNATPMYSDAFHVYPTDGKVNGQRSNFPYGECANGTTLPSNNGVDALGKLGNCTFAGYTGTVFEPDDQYKGDFARSYFYMAACYNNRIATWSSDMLNGTSYPAFSSWAINLLLKWHRQDPVSEKEINRNEAVYSTIVGGEQLGQSNRNPFIDHPELAEYIWGNHVGVPWNENAGGDPMFAMPIDGSSIVVGTCAVNVARSVTINVRGIALEDDVTVTVVGDGFSASASTLSKAAVNSTAGADLTVSFFSPVACEANGTLTLTSGDVATTAILFAVALDGLPAGPATQVSDRSFVATWTNIDPAGTVYKLYVYQGGITLDGFPVNVRAEAEKDLVEDLMPSTDYTYVVESATLRSNEVAVRTADPVPFIEMSSNAELDEITTSPEEPGEPVIIFIESVNINDPITIAVDEPFQVSTDKASWSNSMAISPDEEQFFLRLNCDVAGTYTSQLTATVGDYQAESLDIVGHIAAVVNFFEDFDADASGFGNYTNTDPYQGNGCQWRFNNAGIYSKEGCPDSFENATQAVRFGKNASSSATMLEDIPNGAGEVSFFSHKWSSDTDATLAVQYSTDSGSTWNDASSVTISGTDYQEFKVPVNVAGKVRLRFQQTAGQRLLLDNVSVSAFSSVERVSADARWVAYARNGEIVIENAPRARAEIFTADGRSAASLRIDGSASVSLPANLYIVVINDTAQRVVVK